MNILYLGHLLYKHSFYDIISNKIKRDIVYKVTKFTHNNVKKENKVICNKIYEIIVNTKIFLYST